MPLIITTQGSEQLRGKLGRFVHASDVEAKQILKDIAIATRDIAREDAPKDLGDGARSISYRTHDLSAEVYTNRLYMITQNYGRRPGNAGPDPALLVGWGARHGFIGQRALYSLATAISRKGFKAHFFMENAAVKAEALIKGRFKQSQTNIENIWQSRQ